MDGAVLGNTFGATVAVQHSLPRGMPMGWLGLPSRQAARTPQVSPAGCRLPCVWELCHGSRHLLIPDSYQIWKRFLQQPLFHRCWMMNSLCSFLSASWTLPRADSHWNYFCCCCRLGNGTIPKEFRGIKAAVSVYTHGESWGALLSALAQHEPPPALEQSPFSHIAANRWEQWCPELAPR